MNLSTFFGVLCFCTFQCNIITQYKPTKCTFPKLMFSFLIFLCLLHVSNRGFIFRKAFVCTVTVWCVVLYSYGIVCCTVQLRYGVLYCTCINISSNVGRRVCNVQNRTLSSTYYTVYTNSCTTHYTITVQYNTLYPNCTAQHTIP